MINGANHDNVMIIIIISNKIMLEEEGEEKTQ